MTETYCFPNLDSLQTGWKHQKDNEIVYLRCLGMNDAAFLWIKKIIEDDDYGKMKTLDLSYNALTNASAHMLFNFAQNKYHPITITLTGNCFITEDIRKDEVKLFIMESVRPRQISLSIVMPSEDYGARILQTEKTVADIAAELKILVNTVNRLGLETEKVNKTTEHHARLFDKHHKSIETKLAAHLCEKYGYIRVTKEEIQQLDKIGYNNETDVFLTSPDGTKVVIGEATNEMKMYAFTQVEKRKEKFLGLPREQLPEKFKNYQKVIPLVGANICDEKFRKMALLLDYLFGHPNNDTYVVEDENKQL